MKQTCMKQACMKRAWRRRVHGAAALKLGGSGYAGQ
jgi:hypothetical protein